MTNFQKKWTKNLKSFEIMEIDRLSKSNLEWTKNLKSFEIYFVASSK